MLSAQVPLVLRDDLHRLAQAHDRSMSAEIRTALDVYLHLAGGAGGPSSFLPPIPGGRHVPVSPRRDVAAPGDKDAA